MTFKFEALDIEASFGENSQGRETKTLINSLGESITGTFELWTIGCRSYELLNNEIGPKTRATKKRKPNSMDINAHNMELAACIDFVNEYILELRQYEMNWLDADNSEVTENELRENHFIENARICCSCSEWNQGISAVTFPKNMSFYFLMYVLDDFLFHGADRLELDNTKEYATYFLNAAQRNASMAEAVSKKFSDIGSNRPVDDVADKVLVIEWWNQHKEEFSNKAKPAAEKTVEIRLVNSKYRTIYNWILEHKKSHP